MNKKLSSIIILCISLISISGCKFCILGKHVSVHEVEGKPYWEAVDSKKAKSIRYYTQACNKEVEDAKNLINAIFVQICSKGHIPKEYFPQAQMIQNDYLKYYYNKYVKRQNVKDFLRTGTIDEIYKRFLTRSYDKSPSNEKLVGACTLYIPRKGMLHDDDHFDWIFRDDKEHIDRAFEYKFDEYKEFYFDRCMINFNLKKITPMKTEKYTECAQFRY